MRAAANADLAAALHAEQHQFSPIWREPLAFHHRCVFAGSASDGFQEQFHFSYTSALNMRGHEEVASTICLLVNAPLARPAIVVAIARN